MAALLAADVRGTHPGSDAHVAATCAPALGKKAGARFSTRCVLWSHGLHAPATQFRNASSPAAGGVLLPIWENCLRRLWAPHEQAHLRRWKGKAPTKAWSGLAFPARCPYRLYLATA